MQHEQKIVGPVCAKFIESTRRHFGVCGLCEQIRNSGVGKQMSALRIADRYCCQTGPDLLSNGRDIARCCGTVTVGLGCHRYFTKSTGRRSSHLRALSIYGSDKHLHFYLQHGTQPATNGAGPTHPEGAYGGRHRTNRHRQLFFGSAASLVKRAISRHRI